MKINMDEIFDDINVENADKIHSKIISPVDTKTSDRISENVMRQVKRSGKKRINFKNLIAVAAAFCIVCTGFGVGYSTLSSKPPVTEGASQSTAPIQNAISKLTIMQVYANDEVVEISDNTVETKTPFYKITKKHVSWAEANEIIDRDFKKKNINHNYYPDSNEGDAREGNGYLITTEYGNYFDIKGDDITRIKVSTKSGWAICCYEGNPEFDGNYNEMNKSGNFVGGGVITLDEKDLEKKHKIMWNPVFLNEDEENSAAYFENMKYSDFDDVMTFEVTTDKDGTENVQTIEVEITFDKEGVMHTNLKK